ncbi:MAG: hypothetical protein IIX71_08460 [Ruminococcus sp.]|nr:hypothetical protein [Ruminococcus sp.]
MTAIQEQAIQLIQQLPDEKIQAIITLAADELSLIALKRQIVLKKKNAFARLEALDLQLPSDFKADEELKQAMEEKYGIAD